MAHPRKGHGVSNWHNSQPRHFGEFSDESRYGIHLRNRHANSLAFTELVQFSDQFERKSVESLYITEYITDEEILRIADSE